MVIKLDVRKISAGSTTNADARSVCGSLPYGLNFQCKFSTVFDRSVYLLSEIGSRVGFESLKTWVGLAKMTDVQLWSAVKNTGHTSPHET